VTRPLVVVHRQTLFDIAENAKELCEFVGLPPISDEVADMERKDSTKRLDRVRRFAPAVEDHAKWMAACITTVQREQARANGFPVADDDAPWIAASEGTFHVINSSVMSALALFVDLDALTINEDWQQVSEQEDGQQA